jgi:hypothetical protein
VTGGGADGNPARVDLPRRASRHPLLELELLGEPLHLDAVREERRNLRVAAGEARRHAAEPF